MPEHDYEDVPVEEDVGVASPETTPTRDKDPRSKLTPPVESMYSMIGSDTGATPTPRPYSYSSSQDDNYNRLHDTKRLSTDVQDEEGYSTVPSEGKGSLQPPLLKPRPQTTYARLHNKGGAKSEGPKIEGGDETVSKVKFNVVMDQLRKTQVHVHVHVYMYIITIVIII